jgi:heme/copper-type cytochrome/quinol oxidase subunit 2
MPKYLLSLVMLSLLSGCTFCDMNEKGRQRTAEEMKNVSPAQYIILGVFVVIMVIAVVVSLCMSTSGGADSTIPPLLIAFIATAVVLVLCA